MQNHPDKFEYLKECPYCHSSNFAHFVSAPDRFSKRDEIFDAVKCRECKLVFQNPRVKEEYIGEYYEEGDDLGYYIIPSEKKKTLYSKIKSIIERQTLIQYFKYTTLGRRNIFIKPFFWPFRKIQKINSVPNFKQGGRLLEIGCSHGDYLKRMQDYGWNVVGNEMNEKMVAHAQSIGLDVTAGKIDETNYEANSFDVVKMSMVLEHLHDPFKMIDRITSWLRPGGQFIFSIPYIEGVEFKIFKEYTYALQLPHHITFLNKKIMREYLEKSGYKNIKFYFQFFDRDVIASAEFKYAATKKPIYKFIHRNKLFRYLVVKPMLVILSIFQKTSRVTVYAEKC